MEKKKRLTKGALIAGIILVAGGLLFGPVLLAGDENKTKDQTKETPVYSVRTMDAQKKTLYAFLDVNGDIESSQQAGVFPDMPGILVSVNVGLGSFVRKGQLIAEVDPSKPGMTYMTNKAYAPISGIVSKIPLSIGTTVGPNTSITVISAGDNLEVNAWIPEREIAGLAVGLKAEVSLQAYPGETFAATVNRVSPVLDNASRTKQISLKFDCYDERINAGMFARIRINTRSYPDVIAVPAEAVVKSRGIDLVYVIRVNEEGQALSDLREVERGVSLQGWTEIKSGLGEGEAVIVQGQQLLCGGESVRIIGSSIAQTGGVR